MKFLLDESADFPLAAYLKELGHDVTAIAHDYPQALKDRDVLAIAQQEQRILITNDRDFAELVFRQRFPHSGVILFRLEAESLQTKIVWLQHILTNYADRLNNFLVIQNAALGCAEQGKANCIFPPASRKWPRYA